MVISDTHIPERAGNLPPQLVLALKEASLIVHAGDICEYWVVEELLSFAPLFAVQGNMDRADVKAKLKKEEIFEVAGKKIGLVHGWGPPWGIEKRVSEVFKSVPTDIIIFGHTHQPFKKVIGEVLYFNPGSPTDTVFAPYFSYGVIEIVDGIIQKAEIVRLSEVNNE